MAFYRRTDTGRLYVLKIWLPDDSIIYKIGMCNTSRSESRLGELLVSWFTHYRYVPYTEMILNKETGYPAELEKHIHKILKNNQIIPDKNVQGKTEFFYDINEQRLLHYLRNFQDAETEHLVSLTDDDYKHLNTLLVSQ